MVNKGDGNRGARIRIEADNMANAITSDILTISNGELLDEVFDCSGNMENNGQLDITLKNVANSYHLQGRGRATLTHAELIDSVVDINDVLSGSRINVIMHDSANAHAPADAVLLQNSTLKAAVVAQTRGNCFSGSNPRCEALAFRSGLITGSYDH